MHKPRFLIPTLVLSLFSLCFLVSSAAPAWAPAADPYCAYPLYNGGFETGTFMGWSTSGAPVVIHTGGHTGWNSAQLGGRDNAVDRVWQEVACPYISGQVRTGLWVYMHTTETGNHPYDLLTIGETDHRGSSSKASYTNNDLPNDTWVNLCCASHSRFDACVPGVTWEVYFEATTDFSNPTWFLVDDVFLETCCYDDAYEANDSFATARAVTPGSYNLRLCPSGDEDWFAFSATAGQQISLHLRIQEAGQATVCLVSPQGQEVACASQSYPNTANLTFIANASGSWRARVHDPGYHTGGSLLQLGIAVTAGPTPTSTSPPSTATRTCTPTSTRTPTRTATPRMRQYLPLVMHD